MKQATWTTTGETVTIAADQNFTVPDRVEYVGCASDSTYLSRHQHTRRCTRRSPNSTPHTRVIRADGDVTILPTSSLAQL